MPKYGKCDFKDLKRLQENIDNLGSIEVKLFIEGCAKELAARLLAKVIKRTPVGQYPTSSGKKGGTLRRGWTSQSTGSGSEGLKTQGTKQYVETLKVNHFGDTYVVEIVNPLHYASYVEYGHRTRNHEGWVQGKFMLTISEQELDTDAPKVIENKLKKLLGECFK
ncbi:MAG: HK97 gp10 family phage protein [Candidatus Cloacimonetes bacterium]|nr:HK97 gp10 family phage protein [Candidatus Cloacimonadota bacterium]